MNIFRVMLGASSVYAQECFAGSFVGTDYNIQQDLTHELPDDWRKFNHKFIPIFLKNHPEKSKVAAGLACSMLWTVSKGIKPEDLLLCPDGQNHYRVAQMTGPYYYCPGENLPHRRPVRWYDQVIDRASMSDGLRLSTGSIAAVCNLTAHSQEIQQLLGTLRPPSIPADDKDSVEDLAAFAMEKHLEDFLVQNWDNTPLGKEYDIYTDNDAIVGQQFPTDTGPIDILAISKDQKTLLVVELKKGRASDVVVGQILRYMGYVQEELAEKDQAVKGIIIAAEDDPRLRRALAVAPLISFYRYQISFRLLKG